MDETIGAKLKKTAEDVVSRVGEAAQQAAHQASERIGEMREVQRLSQMIRTLEKEKDQCKTTMIDLVMRMMDQNAFAEALLRPEYNRIKEIDVEIAELEKEKHAVGLQVAETAAEAAPAAEPEQPTEE